MTNATHNNTYEPVVTEVLSYNDFEPVHGSVIMTQGPSGTAWQRLFNDGLWHSTTGYTKTWADIQRLAARHKMPAILLHDAEDYA